MTFLAHLFVFDKRENELEVLHSVDIKLVITISIIYRSETRLILSIIFYLRVYSQKNMDGLEGD